MTLEEAIEHAEEVAKNNERKAIRYRKHGGGYVYEAEARACDMRAAEHRKLAEWLRELQAYRKERE